MKAPALTYREMERIWNRLHARRHAGMCEAAMFHRADDHLCAIMDRDGRAEKRAARRIERKAAGMADVVGARYGCWPKRLRLVA